MFVIGFGLQDPSDGGTESPWPMVTRGRVLKVVRCGGERVMVVTSAVVGPGASGGLVVHEPTGRAVAMVVSNTRQGRETESVCDYLLLVGG